MSELDELVNDEPEVIETPEVEPIAESEAEPKAEETPPDVKVEKEVEPTPTDKPESETVPIAAVIDERRKRQALEQEIAAMKADQEQKPAVPRPDVFEDQDGAFNFLESTIDQKLSQHVIGLSRDMMASAHDDYAEMEQEFVQMAQENPQLTQEMQAHPNPARFAYETAKNRREYKEMQNVGEYREKLTAQIREEERAKILAEMKQDKEKETEQSNVAHLPNLAKSTASSGGFATPTDESLDEIMGR